MKLPAPSPNPRYGELCAILAAHPEWLSPWSGHFFRFQTIQFPAGRNILSGTGARHRGGRWNPPGLAALYGSTTDTAALEEAKANDRYYGLETKTPRLVVAIEAKMGKMLDLTSPGIRRQLGITLAELSGEDWRKLLQSGQEMHPTRLAAPLSRGRRSGTLLQSGQESLSQALGRAAASTGASGLLVRSTAVHQAHNVILFPPLGGSDRLNIIEGDALARLTVGKKP